MASRRTAASGRLAWNRFVETFIKRSTAGDPEDFPCPDTAGDAKTLLIEFWKKTYDAADKARARAQVGYTITSALGIAYIGAVITTRLVDQGIFVKSLAAIALAGWVLTVWAYITAATAAAPIRELEDSEQDDDGKWVYWAKISLDLVQEERAVQIWRLRRANVIAVIFTAVAAVSVWISIMLPAGGAVSAKVEISAEGSAFFTAECSVQSKRITLKVDPKDLEKQFVGVSEVEGCQAGQKFLVKRSWFVVVDLGKST